MQSLIEKFLHCSDPDKLNHLDEYIFNHPSINFYWKDRRGKYIACNDTTAKMAGFASGEEILGSTDFDLCWLEYAEQYKKNDTIVIKNEKSYTLNERISTYDGQTYNCISCKSGFYSGDGKVIGVAGITICLDNTFDNHLALKIDTDSLSQRQKQCLSYLVGGMTIKKIAMILHLSPRTVEHHVDIIKNKLGYRTISDLVMAATGINKAI